jgi:hypothetical protein
MTLFPYTTLFRSDPKAIPNQMVAALSTKGLTDAISGFVVAAEAAVEGQDGSLPKMLGSCKSLTSALAKFGTQTQQKTGSPELNSLMVRVTDSAQRLVKQLQTLAESAQKAAQTRQQAPAALAPCVKQRATERILAMPEAETKVVGTRRMLDLAEARLRDIKEGAPKGSPKRLTESKLIR